MVGFDHFNFGKIILIRHGPPDAPSARMLDKPGFAAWARSYEDAGLRPDTSPPRQTAEMARSVDTVFTSTLPRSRQSANALGMVGLTALSVFDEPALPVPKLHFLRLPVGGWVVLCRSLWRAGLHQDGETYSAARTRGIVAAETLESAALNGGVALIGHGWMNRFIGAALVDRGWQQRGGGAKLWGMTSYLPPRGPSITLHS